jgi:hypothetical protein
MAAAVSDPGRHYSFYLRIVDVGLAHLDRRATDGGKDTNRGLSLQEFSGYWARKRVNKYARELARVFVDMNASIYAHEHSL